MRQQKQVLHDPRYNNCLQVSKFRELIRQVAQNDAATARIYERLYHRARFTLRPDCGTRWIKDSQTVESQEEKLRKRFRAAENGISDAVSHFLLVTSEKSRLARGQSGVWPKLPRSTDKTSKSALWGNDRSIYKTVIAKHRRRRYVTWSPKLRDIHLQIRKSASKEFHAVSHEYASTV